MIGYVIISHIAAIQRTDNKAMDGRYGMHCYFLPNVVRQRFEKTMVANADICYRSAGRQAAMWTRHHATPKRLNYPLEILHTFLREVVPDYIGCNGRRVEFDADGLIDTTKRLDDLV